MVSTKFYSDYDELEVFASAWATEGQMDVERLRILEMSFLNAIQWNILVSENEFYEKLKTVERLLAMKEGLSRGWFTYTEMELLMPTIEIAKRILNYTTILMFSYACSIATIALSSVILSSIPIMTNDLANQQTNLTNISLMSQQLLPVISFDDATIERTFDDPTVDSDRNFNFSRNFTINFPLFNHVTNWDDRRNHHNVLVSRKLDSIRLPW